MNKEIIIPLSKGKIMLLNLGSIAFVLGCIWLFGIDDGSKHDSIFIKTIAAIGALFFSLAGIVGIKKMFDKRAGLIISDKGIINNSGAFDVGLIKWEDITGFDVYEIKHTKMLQVFVKNPEKYIEAEKSKIKRKMMRMNGRYGSPISISSNALKIKFKDLQKVVLDNFEKYGSL